jgi:hypothetical protein
MDWPLLFGLKPDTPRTQPLAALLRYDLGHGPYLSNPVLWCRKMHLPAVLITCGLNTRAQAKWSGPTRDVPQAVSGGLELLSWPSSSTNHRQTPADSSMAASPRPRSSLHHAPQLPSAML